MYFYIYILFLSYNVYLGNGENITDNVVLKLTDIADVFLNLFDNDDKINNGRIQELKEKLTKIDSYVIDRNKLVDLIRNKSRQSYFNKTNFYEALLGQDHFRLLNHTKNLYLTLKEKMNSDDLLKILSERAEEKVKISARRMLTGDTILKLQRDRDLAETVDKYLGEVAMDYHTFDDEVTVSHYWDPKIELEERLNYNKRNGRRLFKGERTNINYYPFIVSVHVMGRFWCGGSIFWNDLIITSAACLQVVYNNRFYRENPRAITVRVGSNHSRIGGEIIDALEVYFHPAYSPKTLSNNIALIRLQRHIYTSHRHRTPKLVQISQNGQGIPYTAKVLLLGWGVTGNKVLPYGPMFLQRKILPIYPPTYCKEIYGDQFNLQNMFCVGTVTTGEGACNHDAGGPALLNGKLVGIISFGPTICGFIDAPTVLTLVGYYADWIETVNETKPGYYELIAKTTTESYQDIKYFNFKDDHWKEPINIIKPINDPDDGEAKNRDKRISRAKITVPVVNKPVVPLRMKTHPNKHNERTNLPVLFTDNGVKPELVLADKDSQKYDTEEDREEENYSDNKEFIYTENKDRGVLVNKNTMPILTLPTPLSLDLKNVEKGQNAKQFGKLMQRLTDLSQNEPAINEPKTQRTPLSKVDTSRNNINKVMYDDVQDTIDNLKEEKLINNINKGMYDDVQNTRGIHKEDTLRNNINRGMYDDIQNTKGNNKVDKLRNNINKVIYDDVRNTIHNNKVDTFINNINTVTYDDIQNTIDNNIRITKMQYYNEIDQLRDPIYPEKAEMLQQNIVPKINQQNFKQYNTNNNVKQLPHANKNNKIKTKKQQYGRLPHMNEKRSTDRFHIL